MLFPGKYWEAYWRLIKATSALAVLGGLAWLGLTSMEMYEGYVELVLGTVIFAPVGVVFLINALGILVVLFLALQQSFSGNGAPADAVAIGNVALMAAAFLISGVLFGMLGLQSILALLSQ